MNVRMIQAENRHIAQLTRKYLRKRHLNFVRLWQKRLQLTGASFGLCVVPKRERGYGEFILVDKKERVYLIKISERNFKARDKREWKDTVVHELLHALFYEHCRKRPLPNAIEERMVGILSSSMIH